MDFLKISVMGKNTMIRKSLVIVLMEEGDKTSIWLKGIADELLADQNYQDILLHLGDEGK